MKLNRSVVESLVRGASLACVITAGGCMAADEGPGADADLSSSSALVGEVTLFSASDRPSLVAASDTQAVELGVRFRTDVAGTVTGIRYYRSAANTGAHTAHLWSNGGRLLASATFPTTTATGWQSVSFAQPVPVSAGRTYVASYHTDVGRYSADTGYFTGRGKDSGPLHAPADGAPGRNGVYHYGATAFPTDSYRGTNYWVDVVLKPTSGGGGAPDAGTPPPAVDAGPPPPPPADAGTPPPPTGSHPFPFSFDDPQFFAQVATASPFSLGCTARSDLSIVAENNGNAVISNNCGSGTSTITRVRLGGDGGGNGNVREGYRCAGSGTMNILQSWLEAKGEGDDHADVIQCYDPNNSPTAVMNLRNSTIRGYNTAATAGLFVADNYALELHVENVLFWGGPYGLRFHTDGRPGSLYMKDVCFYGRSASDHSFGYNAFLINPYPPNIAEWTNVSWCTIENGQLVKHGAIARP